MLSYLTGFKLPLAYIFFVHPEDIGTQRKWGKSSLFLLNLDHFQAIYETQLGRLSSVNARRTCQNFRKLSYVVVLCSYRFELQIGNENILFEVRRFCCCFLNSTWRRIDYCFSRWQPPSRPLRGPETTSHPGFDLKFIYCPCVDWHINVIPYQSEHLLSVVWNLKIHLLLMFWYEGKRMVLARKRFG